MAKRYKLSDVEPEDLVNQKLRRLVAEKLATVPPASTGRAYLVKLLGLSDDELLDEFFSTINANPDRIGCPPTLVLVDLASSDDPFNHPAWDHAIACFPCGTDVRLLRAAARNRRLP